MDCARLGTRATTSPMAVKVCVKDALERLLLGPQSKTSLQSKAINPLSRLSARSNCEHATGAAESSRPRHCIQCDEIDFYPESVLITIIQEEKRVLFLRSQPVFVLYSP